MTQLRDAYQQILQLYQSEKLIPGRLEGIGFGNRWTVVFATLGQTGF